MYDVAALFREIYKDSKQLTRLLEETSQKDIARSITIDTQALRREVEVALQQSIDRTKNFSDSPLDDLMRIQRAMINIQDLAYAGVTTPNSDPWDYYCYQRMRPPTQVINDAVNQLIRIVKRLEATDDERTAMIDEQVDGEGHPTNSILHWTDNEVMIQTQHWICYRCNSRPCVQERHERIYRPMTGPTGIFAQVTFQKCVDPSCDQTMSHAHQTTARQRPISTLNLEEACNWEWGAESMWERYEERRRTMSEANEDVSELESETEPTLQSESEAEIETNDSTVLKEINGNQITVRTKNWTSRWCDGAHCNDERQHKHRCLRPKGPQQETEAECILFRCSDKTCQKKKGMTHAHQRSFDKTLQTIPMSYFETLPRQDQGKQKRKSDAISEPKEQQGKSAKD